ncbi:hypothetical protein [Candidatus Uabimicrobium amorphum]|uniref:Uncharacterized protein n=1 Tax=Uabimicrobium amorphum TaxID=2596890 RepID=A0A5S9IL44_UABAM|nr:hypothetical protein [Candidatus Uabimicrobium amorphum]BBM83446.1 hypothetical protein UABAM_01798 [Candidatus Uabimicrobium amorphum]
MSLDLHQVISGYMEVAVGVAIAVAILVLTRRHEKRNMRSRRLLDIHSGVSKSYHLICDARWICRPRPTNVEAYYKLLIAIGEQRGVFIDALNELKSASLLSTDDLSVANDTLCSIDKYLLELLEESTHFDAKSGIPIPKDGELQHLFTDEGKFPLYRDFVSVWSTLAKSEKGCMANDRFRVPYKKLAALLEKYLQE